MILSHHARVALRNFLAWWMGGRRHYTRPTTFSRPCRTSVRPAPAMTAGRSMPRAGGPSKPAMKGLFREVYGR